MLNRLTILRPSVELLFEDQRVPSYLRIDNQDWKQLGYVLQLLKPFSYWTKALSSCLIPTIHLPFMAFNQLFDVLDVA